MDEKEREELAERLYLEALWKWRKSGQPAEIDLLIPLDNVPDDKDTEKKK